MFIEGIPLMLLEFAIGQKFRMSAMRVWKDIHPSLFGVGLASLVVSLFLCIYYVVVIAWCLFYFFISMQPDLPWKVEELCTEYRTYKDLQDVKDRWEKNKTFYSQPAYKNNTLYYNISQYSEKMYNESKANVSNFKDCCVIDPPQWYFYNGVLDVSIDIDDYSHGVNLKLLGCLVLAWVVVYLCVVKGIKSSGKVNIYDFQGIQVHIRTLVHTDLFLLSSLGSIFYCNIPLYHPDNFILSWSYAGRSWYWTKSILHS